MNLAYFLPILLVIGIIPVAFAETETLEFDTIPFGIYNSQPIIALYEANYIK